MSAQAQPLTCRKLEDFGQLQARYQSLNLAERARQMLEDAKDALAAAERITRMATADPHGPQAFAHLRKNTLLLGRMRASDAKTALLDPQNDFPAATLRKIASWRKSMERLGAGEGIALDKGKEYIPSEAPLAMALIGSAGVSNYLSILQLALAEMGKTDSANAARYASCVAEIRRCATVISDCDHASGIDAAVR